MRTLTVPFRIACVLTFTATLLTACSGSAPVAMPAHQTTRCEVTSDGDKHAAPRFRLLGEVRWDVDTAYGGVPVGGLSSIDWDAGRGVFWLVSDDRAVNGPARFYSARMQYDERGLQHVWLSGMHTLLDPEQRPYANAQQPSKGVAVPDAEAMRAVPGSDRLLWASEGDFPRGFGPELNEIRSDGHWLRRWPLPESLTQIARNSGPRNGFTLEGMAFSPDARTLWLAMEGALKQDGAMPTPGDAGAPVRITALDAHSHQPLRQIACQPDALPASIALLPQRAVNGVSDILADGPDHLLVLERSFSLGEGWGAKLYRIDIRESATTDVLNLHRIPPDSSRTARKTLVLDFARLGLRSVDNLEGMTWGPPLTNGERVLLLVSDNNFNPAEVTQFIALAELPRCKTEQFTMAPGV
ncbi:esterase-like activity of phytase family protein [Diaphorobacter sp. NR2-3-3-1]|nr:esterase-like activity of phytase family protein [Diaphorobacter caeni]